MHTYIAFLRGINVGGRHKIKMNDLQVMFEDLGFNSVTIYIQSGNIIFKNISENRSVLQDKIKVGIKEYFDFEIPVLVITYNMLKGILSQNPFLNRLSNEEIEAKKMYFTLLFEKIDPIKRDEIKITLLSPEEFFMTEHVIYLYAAIGYGKTKLNNTFFEKKLSCRATTRNLRTMSKLLEIGS